MPPALIAGLVLGVLALFAQRPATPNDGGAEAELEGDPRSATSAALNRPDLARVTLSPHYTAADLVVSGSRPDLVKRIQPTDAQLGALASIAAGVLEPLGRRLGVFPHVTSGLRSEELNQAVHGAADSQHLKGEAVDLAPPAGSTAVDLMRALIAAGITFDQAIAYHPSRGGHLHLSYKGQGGNRRELRAAPATGGYPVVKSADDAARVLAAS